jgi:hypothetical protein
MLTLALEAPPRFLARTIVVQISMHDASLVALPSHCTCDCERDHRHR